MRLAPRLRGRAEEVEGGFKWSLMITIGPDDGDHDIHLQSKRTFPTREIALESLKMAAAEVVQKVCELMGATEVPEIHNLKEGKVQTIAEFAGAV